MTVDQAIVLAAGCLWAVFLLCYACLFAIVGIDCWMARLKRRAPKRKS